MGHLLSIEHNSTVPIREQTEKNGVKVFEIEISLNDFPSKLHPFLINVFGGYPAQAEIVLPDRSKPTLLASPVFWISSYNCIVGNEGNTQPPIFIPADLNPERQIINNSQLYHVVLTTLVVCLGSDICTSVKVSHNLPGNLNCNLVSAGFQKLFTAK